MQDADKAVENVGRIRERWPKASRFAGVEVKRDEKENATSVSWSCKRDKLRLALGRDGAYLLLSDKTDLSPEELWCIYI